MRKIIPLFSTAFLLLIAVVLVATSCKKEPQHRAFKAKIDTWYRVVPNLPPVPVLVGGKTFLGVAYFPGGGTGTATHIGACVNYFNQLAYIDPSMPEAPPAGSVSAPVKSIPSYVSRPGTTIQPGDFTELELLINTLKIPNAISGNIINSVLANKKGDAIYTSAITGSGATFPLSATKVGFNGKGLIVGGAGKFANAIGEFSYNGYFNLLDQNDAEYNADGWIDY